MRWLRGLSPRTRSSRWPSLRGCVGALVTLALIAVVLVPRTLFALRSIFTLRAVLAVLVVPVWTPILAGRVLVLAVLLAAILAARFCSGVALLLAGADRFALVAVIVVAVEIERLLATWLLLRLRLALFEARAGLAQDAEIMVRELEVIFDVDAVALLLRVAREVLVLLVQLARVAARAAVDAVAGIATTLAAAATLALTAATTAAAIIIVATTATAAGLPVVDQACVLSRRTKIWSCSEMRCKPPSRTDDLDEIGASNLPGPPDCSDLKAKDAGHRSKPTNRRECVPLPA